MIRKEELFRIQRSLQLPLSTIEKDYVLSLVIWGIAKHQNMSTSWIFKGGTALKKCYFGDYRFSEDLDYTLTTEASIDPEVIYQDLVLVFALIYESFGLKIGVENLAISPFPDKNGLVLQIKVPYQGPLLSSGSLPKIKLDLTQDEILVDAPEPRDLLHQYSDSALLDTKILCYSIYEIFAEKLRALVERTRPRDLYDVVHLGEFFIKNDFQKSYLQKVAIAKFKYKKLDFRASLMNIDQRAIEEARADWHNMLLHQIQALGSFDDFLAKARVVMEWVVNCDK